MINLINPFYYGYLINNMHYTILRHAFIALLCSMQFYCTAQLSDQKKYFTHADTLRGSITPERDWWDVIQYDLHITPNIQQHTITGFNTITFLVTAPGQTMQIDLQQPLIVDSVVGIHKKYKYKQAGNVCWVYTNGWPIRAASIQQITIYYHGKPTEAIKPPWDGGMVWRKDANGNPWVGVACQGLGASVWWPCKDHQSDEPDSMAIHVTIPNNLVDVSNGRLRSVQDNHNGTKTWNWFIHNPINNYDATINIGKYVHWHDVYNGEKGSLDLDFWVLDYNIDKAKQQFKQVKPMLKCFEYWFGAYPFYEDGYKLIETIYLGMEHQGAIAYGNKFTNGYLGNDLSNTGWGLLWDYIIIHESGHEWFGNNITTKDIADMWVHEGFTQYSEVLFTEYLSGRKAADAYVQGLRANINNNKPIIAHYGVNEEGSGDMYSKGANLIHMIRTIINNDTLFRSILRGLNKTFYHQTVTTQQIEEYINQQSHYNFTPLFNQYLRTTQIPTLEYSILKKTTGNYIRYRWTNCVKNFNLQLGGKWDGTHYTLLSATTQWQEMNVGKLTIDMAAVYNKNFYIQCRQVNPQ